MELIIAMVVAALLVRRGVVDVVAMATGRTPPSHAYRMALLQQAPDPDQRTGLRRVFRHWYLDACEDVDEWRATRRMSRPERRARRQERKAKRREAIAAAKAKAGEVIRDRKAQAGGDAGVPPSVPTPPPAPTVPDLPDNVLPFRRDAAAGAERKEDNSTGTADQQTKKTPEPSANGTNEGGKRMTTGTNAPATGSDQAGLNPHVSALNASADHLGDINTMLERIQAQMTQHGMGSEVTGALGTARDANTQAAEAMRRAAEVTEQVNRKVQEAYNASRGQAASKEYQQQGQ